MPVHKRSQGLDADYYVAGNTVRRASRREAPTEEPVTRRAEPIRRRDASHRGEPLRDTRSPQDRRRADPPRAYYAPEPETRRLTREEVNLRTARAHDARRDLDERRRRDAEEEQRRREEAEALRRREHRVRGVFAVLLIGLVSCVGFGFYTLLSRSATLENMLVEQRRISADIEDQQRRLEELEAEINMAGDIGRIQDYARDDLHMDYAKKENTRVVALPD